MGGGVEKTISQADLEVKKKCFGDGLSLTLDIFRNDNKEVQTYKSYSKLDISGEVIDLQYQLLGLFEEVTTIKNRRHAFLTGISKLCNKPNLKGRVAKTDMTVLF